MQNTKYYVIVLNIENRFFDITDRIREKEIGETPTETPRSPEQTTHDNELITPPIHDNDLITPPINPHKKSKIHAGEFWQSPEVKKLFPSTTDTDLPSDITIIGYIDKLNKSMYPISNPQSIIHQETRDYPLTTKQTQKLYQTCSILRTL